MKCDCELGVEDSNLYRLIQSQLVEIFRCKFHLFI